MNVTLREATKKDAELIADVSRRTFFETFAADNTKENMDRFLAEQFTKGKLMLEVGQPGVIFFLAYVDGEVAGYVKLRERKAPPEPGNQPALEIARLYAVTNKIGSGVGKALMQQSIDVAVQKNKKLVWLGVWEKNERAIKFYQKWGFEKFSQQDFILGEDVQTDWLMKKELY